MLLHGITKIKGPNWISHCLVPALALRFLSIGSNGLFICTSAFNHIRVRLMNGGFLFEDCITRLVNSFCQIKTIHNQVWRKRVFLHWRFSTISWNNSLSLKALSWASLFLIAGYIKDQLFKRRERGYGLGINGAAELFNWTRDLCVAFRLSEREIRR